MNETPHSSPKPIDPAVARVGAPGPIEGRPEKRHLSFTQLNMFLRCPRQYEYRYIRGIKAPPSGAMVQSRVWHQTVERNYRQKIESDRDLTLGEMQEFFAAQFDVALGSEEIAFEPDEKPGKLKDQGTAIVAAHHKTIAPAVRPLLVEERFTVDLGEDFPFDLVGVWDLVERDGTIADNKAYGKAPRQEDLDKDLQFTAYALGYRTTHGRAEPGLRMDAIVKTLNPRAVQLHTRRTNDDCRWLLGLIEEVGQAIDSGIFYPNPNGWHCSPRFCGYWGLCMGSKNGR
ncbi:MAG: PD-(D/E)XK nuclease family protein [Armatimonadota bacterium]|nr:PD-(D/E)XK nuclease family protein [Armatimonadota bacterium]MDR7503263.1 PD-(D/E)XK nuclease family protein [Armatimonadota bacterium]